MNAPDDRPIALLIIGSPRVPSHTDALVRCIGDALEVRGMRTEYWTTSFPALPLADPRYHRDPSSHPDPNVRDLVAHAERADAFVLGSPIYHSSYSAVLKNALDHLANRHFAYKPVGLASHGGGRTSQAVDHLRIVVRSLNAMATPTQVCTQDSDYEGDGPFVVADALIRSRVARMANELDVLARSLRVERSSLLELAR